MPNKKQQAKQKLINSNKTYSIGEALELIKKIPSAKFDETIEAHFRLGIDPKKGEQQVRNTVILPNPFGKTKKIIVFTKNIAAAKKIGVETIGDEQLIQEIKKQGKIDADLVIATPDMMKELAQIAKILGPRGLMPSPKNNTVTNNLEQTIKEFRQGKIEFRNDDSANLHQTFGKKSMTVEQLKANLETLLTAITKAKPTSSKGIFIKKIALCSTMGPSVNVSI